MGKTICKAMDHDFSKTLFALCTHGHGDHSKGVRELMGAGVDVVMSEGTYNLAHVKGFDYRFKKIAHGGVYKAGDFVVNAFSVNHDCPGGEPLGFLIKHPECGLTLFVTDTNYLPNTFSGLNNIIIEANYCLDIMRRRLDEGKLQEFLRNRIMKNHLSLTECKKALSKNDLSAVNNILLIHLSDSNSDAMRFKNDVYEQTLKTVNIAEAGLELSWNLTPFDF